MLEIAVPQQEPDGRVLVEALGVLAGADAIVDRAGALGGERGHGRSPPKPISLIQKHLQFDLVGDRDAAHPTLGDLGLDLPGFGDRARYSPKTSVPSPYTAVGYAVKSKGSPFHPTNEAHLPLSRVPRIFPRPRSSAFRRVTSSTACCLV